MKFRVQSVSSSNLVDKSLIRRPFFHHKNKTVHSQERMLQSLQLTSAGQPCFLLSTALVSCNSLLRYHLYIIMGCFLMMTVPPLIEPWLNQFNPIVFELCTTHGTIN